MILKPGKFAKPIKGHWATKNLIACLLMNEGSGDKVIDVSGNNRIITLMNSPNWIPGPAIDFDGSTQYGSSTWTDFDGRNGFTVIARVNPDSVDSSEDTIIGKYDYGGGKREWRLLRYEDDIRWFIGEDGTYNSAREEVAATVLTVGKWVDVACIWDGANTKIYIDGILKTSDTYGTGLYYSDSPILIGIAGNGSHVHYWDGKISFIYIFNRALAASEIAGLYREPFCMFDYEPIELWSAATQGGAAPPVGKTGAKYVPYGSLGVQTFAA